MSITANPAAAIKVAYGSFAYTGFCPETVEVERDANVEHVFCNGDAVATIISNKLTRYTLELLITTGTIVPPDKGAKVTFTNPSNTSTAAMCMASKVAHSTMGAKLSMTLELPDGLTYD